jgi:AMP deaminase
VAAAINKNEQRSHAAQVSQPRSISPTSSMKTNISSNNAPAEGSQHYQQFPAQAARIPASHSQVKLDANAPLENGSSLQYVTSRGQSHESAVASPPLTAVTRESSWPVEGFGDLHLSASEPRIFPGIVSRPQRRDSVRQNSTSETDDYGSVGTSKKSVKSVGKKSLDGAVEEQPESDGEMEEAGGTDE